MATTTTNLGLIKPGGTDKIRIAQFNQNSETLDAAIGPVGTTSLQTQMNNVQDALAIIANGDSHPAITAGQFVYVKNNTHSVAEGLYVASANISANGQITTSNVSADTNGGMNALKTALASLSDQIANLLVTQKTKLVDSAVAASGDTAWHSASGTFDSTYDKYLVIIGSHGTISTSFIIDKQVLSLLDSGITYKQSSYWNGSNLGQISLYGNNYSINAITQNYAFDYLIYGLK